MNINLTETQKNIFEKPTTIYTMCHTCFRIVKYSFHLTKLICITKIPMKTQISHSLGAKIHKGKRQRVRKRTGKGEENRENPIEA